MANYQRWYENDRDVNRVVLILEVLPDDLLNIIAAGVCVMMDRQCKTFTEIANYKSLGRDNILRLHKSQQKRRKQDVNAYLRRALVTMSMLSPAYQRGVSKNVLEMMEIIHHYIQLTCEHHKIMSLRHVSDITQTYNTQGLEATRLFLTEIQNEQLEKLASIHQNTLNHRVETCKNMDLMIYSR